MKARDIPPDTDLTQILLKVPAKALRAFRAYGGGEPLMYPVGDCMGYGFMMSDEPVGADKRRLYPLPPEVSRTDLLDWTVVTPKGRAARAAD